MTTKRKHYTEDFKLEAVRLLEQGDKPPARSRVSRVSSAISSRNGKKKWTPKATFGSDLRKTLNRRRIEVNSALYKRLNANF